MNEKKSISHRIKDHIGLLIAIAAAVLILLAAFWPEPGAHAAAAPTVPETAGTETVQQTLPPETGTAAPTAAPTIAETQPETQPETLPTDAPANVPDTPREPQPSEKPKAENVCLISISCATILDNYDLCDPDKWELVPEDGMVLYETEVEFTPGESVFDVLQRVCIENGIHLESEWTPLYNSAYIEGIHNLYEFDVGPDSGWMYSVNGWFPNFGCSKYTVENGDVIRWQYTCDLGDDIGGANVLG